MPATYLSPGVYVEEVPSGSAPIAGVGTSTAGFIGIMGASSKASVPPALASKRIETVTVVGLEGESGNNTFVLPTPSLQPNETFYLVEAADSYEFKVGIATTKRAVESLTLEAGKVVLTLATALSTAAPLNGTFKIEITTPAAAPPLIKPDPAVSGQVKLCTNFAEFKKFFGDFSTDAGQNLLAHGVFGFFRNGGTRCYVLGIASEAEIDSALEKFEAIDEIAIVVAPGITTETALNSINGHCERMGDRTAIFDSPSDANLSSPTLLDDLKPFNSQYAAVYFPWIQVFDPATQAQHPDGNGLKHVPPSGHVAGLYARIDTQRGVHKAPANETLIGAVGLKYAVSKRVQDGLNPSGINCIRDLNGNIRVWGARTLGGDANNEFKYINVRRLFNFIRESLDEGTQWTVFEPNSPELWAAIRRNVSAFLTQVWRSGALFGNTPAQAFYVKCDEENNPLEVREQGQVVIEIGVAVVKPAEFVIFRLSQWSGEPS
ncbi:MAG: phage tail sheath family protein [Phormidesmis priestleyi]|uniref:Phage tail sheath family protein n=1 Tax=Phormidesmis priestleyi TaxID=268141 RepID=A0A2W4XGZ4_9CYAN|nr:MAG: phage tail sheath family protein [Phormidesmis priestleyi]